MELSPGKYNLIYPQFLSEKKKDLVDLNAELDQELPLAVETWTGVKKDSFKVMVMGIEYHIGEIKYIDRTYHVPCKNQLYVIKTLIPKKIAELDRDAIQNTVRSFSCE